MNKDRSYYNRILVCKPSKHAKRGWWTAAPFNSKF